MKYLIGLLLLLLTNLSYANNYLDKNLKKFNWNGIEVVWLEDSSFPTYNLTVYFSGGAIDESKNKIGITELMFNEMTSGTTRYSKKEILDVLEFYGTSFGASVTHEYSTFSLAGLVKDLEPSLKMVCHIFKNATYPVKEIKKTIKRAETGLKNIVNNHGGLASRVFREVSLQGTAYSSPVTGKLRTLKRIRAKDLHARLKHFNKKVKKRIYIKAPAGIAGVEKIISNDCGWSDNSKLTKPSLAKTKESTKDKNTIFFVPVPKANQAQIRIGTYLSSEQTKRDFTKNELASRYMGGGFTSVLMQELRVKRGLTYSAGAYASAQQMYGRTGINTFTKNETIVQTLNVIKEVIERESKEIPKANFSHLKRFLKGSYLLGLESSTAFLKNLLFFDHIGRPYGDIYKFPSEVDAVSLSEAQNKIKELYDWNKQTKLVLGNKKLIPVLKKAGFKVKVLDYKKYL